MRDKQESVKPVYFPTISILQTERCFTLKFIFYSTNRSFLKQPLGFQEVISKNTKELSLQQVISSAKLRRLMESIDTKFGFRVRQLRTSLGISQEKLAYMGHIERGTVSPSLKKVSQIAKALNVSAESLVADHQPPKLTYLTTVQPLWIYPKWPNRCLLFNLTLWNLIHSRNTCC